nr:hypothetical protein [uncultured Acetatifactor sp.]
MSNMRHVILSAFAGIGIGLFAGGKFIGRQYEKHCELIEKQADRFSETSALMQQWVKVYQSGHNLQDYFKKNNYRKIAVYGMSEIGYMILKELEETEIEVLYCIDKNADNLFAKIDVRRPDEELQPVDAVIVAVIHFYDEVKDALQEKLDCPIISLSDVVWEVS